MGLSLGQKTARGQEGALAGVGRGAVEAAAGPPESQKIKPAALTEDTREPCSSSGSLNES